MPTVLIQNGTIVNADSTAQADLLIDGAVIKEIRAHSSRYAVWRQ